MRVLGSQPILWPRLGWLLLIAAAGVHAESVYKCRGADGNLAFQDRPCAGTRQQSQFELAPAPPSAPSPDYGVASSGRAKAATGGRSFAVRNVGRAEAQSYECRAANGEVFYRHSGCPKSITQSNPGRQRRGSDSSSVSVSAIALTRSEACKRQASAGSIGRGGRERDERVSTYERNAGRDPCR